MVFSAVLEDPSHYTGKTRLTALHNHMATAETVGQIMFPSINREIAKGKSHRLEGGGFLAPNQGVRNGVDSDVTLFLSLRDTST